MVDLSVKKEQLEQNIRQAKAQGMVLPNLAQLRIPDLIPADYGNWFRMGWYNGENGSWRKTPVFKELLPEVTGVPCRILALSGDPVSGAAFCCDLYRMVTGREEQAASLNQNAVAALWQYNITGWALADLYESQKKCGDRLFGVCFGKAEAGITAAGDLIKARYPRAKLAAGSVAENSNVRNLDVLCKTDSALQCCISVAKYFELGVHDVLLTVLPGTELTGTETCDVKELTYPERKAMHFGRTMPDEELNATWEESYWSVLYDQVIELDIRINEFNDAVL